MTLRIRALLLRLALTLGGLIVALALGEGLARVLPLPVEGELKLGIHTADVPGLYAHDLHYGVVPTPGFEGEVVFPSGSVPLRFDSLGMRGPEPPRPATEPRWLMLGDSFLAGLQVREERTISAQLADALGQPVLNSGISGLGTPAEVSRYRLIDHQLDVHGVILLLFTGNDITDNARDHIQHLPEPVPPLEPQPISAQVPGSGLAWLRQRSLLWAQLRVLSWRTFGGEPGGEVDDYLTQQIRILTVEGEPALASLMGPTRAALCELRDRTKARGQPLLVALAPPIQAVDLERLDDTLHYFELDDHEPAPDTPQAMLLRTLAEDGIPSCDLTPALRASQQRGEAPYLYFDGHWSRTGHAVAAQALAACIREQGITLEERR